VIRRHLSYANVMATAAVFIALGGASYAATTIGKGSVTNSKLARGSVTGSKIANNAVTSGKVKNGSLSQSDFKKGTLLKGATGAPAVKFWAKISDFNSDAKVLASSGGVTVQKTAAGHAAVTFPSDVSNCAVILTSRGPVRFVRATTSSSGATVDVESQILTSFSAFETTTDPFDIAVFC
jgi:hypothetical protein